MSRQAQLALTIATIFLVVLIYICIFASDGSGLHSSFISTGNTLIPIILIGFVTVKLIWFAAAISFIIQGFRVHWGWGLANLFLFPIIGIVFFFMHRRKGQFPMILLASGLGLLVVLITFLRVSD